MAVSGKYGKVLISKIGEEEPIFILRAGRLQCDNVRKEGSILHHGKLSAGQADSRLPAEEIILCPHQPGNLKISKGACGRRYLHSQRIIYFERLLGNSLFLDGFSLCRKCSMGKQALREERMRK